MQNPNLKQWRDSRGLSQSQFAKLLPISLRTLQNWESTAHKSQPPDFLWRALRDLDVELGKKSKITKSSK